MDDGFSVTVGRWRCSQNSRRFPLIAQTSAAPAAYVINPLRCHWVDFDGWIGALPCRDVPEPGDVVGSLRGTSSSAASSNVGGGGMDDTVGLARPESSLPVAVCTGYGAIDLLGGSSSFRKN